MTSIPSVDPANGNFPRSLSEGNISTKFFCIFRECYNDPTLDFYDSGNGSFSKDLQTKIKEIFKNYSNPINRHATSSIVQLLDSHPENRYYLIKHALINPLTDLPVFGQIEEKNPKKLQTLIPHAGEKTLHRSYSEGNFPPCVPSLERVRSEFSLMPAEKLKAFVKKLCEDLLLNQPKKWDHVYNRLLEVFPKEHVHNLIIPEMLINPTLVSTNESSIPNETIFDHIFKKNRENAEAMLIHIHNRNTNQSKSVDGATDAYKLGIFDGALQTKSRYIAARLWEEKLSLEAEGADGHGLHFYVCCHGTLEDIERYLQQVIQEKGEENLTAYLKGRGWELSWFFTYKEPAVLQSLLSLLKKYHVAILPLFRGLTSRTVTYAQFKILWEELTEEQKNCFVKEDGIYFLFELLGDHNYELALILKELEKNNLTTEQAGTVLVKLFDSCSTALRAELFLKALKENNIPMLPIFQWVDTENKNIIDAGIELGNPERLQEVLRFIDDEDLAIILQNDKYQRSIFLNSIVPAPQDGDTQRKNDCLKTLLEQIDRLETKGLLESKPNPAPCPAPQRKKRRSKKSCEIS
jgi:hypothetical protein